MRKTGNKYRCILCHLISKCHPPPKKFGFCFWSNIERTREDDEREWTMTIQKNEKENKHSPFNVAELKWIGSRVLLALSIFKTVWQSLLSESISRVTSFTYFKCFSFGASVFFSVCEFGSKINICFVFCSLSFF